MILLGAGAIAGLLLAASSVIVIVPPVAHAQLPPGIVAEVNGVTITRAEYEAALSLATAGRDDAADQMVRDAVLDELINQELLVAEAIRLGLPRREAAMRTSLLAAMREAVIVSAGVPADDDAAAEAAIDRHLDACRARAVIRRGRP